jgi:hypothetical protein
LAVARDGLGMDEKAPQFESVGLAFNSYESEFGWPDCTLVSPLPEGSCAVDGFEHHLGAFMGRFWLFAFRESIVCITVRRSQTSNRTC